MLGMVPPWHELSWHSSFLLPGLPLNQAGMHSCLCDPQCAAWHSRLQQPEGAGGMEGTAIVTGRMGAGTQRKPISPAEQEELVCSVTRTCSTAPACSARSGAGPLPAGRSHHSQ